MKKQWRTVPNFPEYEVSNHGDVRSFKNGKKTTLKGSKRKFNEYTFVKLRNASGSKTFGVHQLVSIAFLEHQLNNGTTVHHKKRKTNNRVENLVVIRTHDPTFEKKVVFKREQSQYKEFNPFE